MGTRLRSLAVTVGLTTALVAGSWALPSAQASATGHYWGERVQYPLTFPVTGSDIYFADDTSLGFGACRENCTRRHEGVDILAPKMTPVVAAADATVFWLGSECCSVFLLHDDGWQTWYIHLNNDTPGTDDGQGWGIADGIVPGARVHAGQVIGWVGDSGNAEDTVPHLHFELHASGWIPVDAFPSLAAAYNGGSSCAAEPQALATLLGGSTLRLGSRGEQVKELQGFLKVEGYQVGSLDGIFGVLTEAGVRAFQQRQGLTVDGIVGPATRAAIRSITTQAGFAAMTDLGGRTLASGARGDDVAELQRFLAVQGFSVGTIDGVFGPVTQRAVKAFQAANGLTADGTVGPATRRVLVWNLSLMAATSCQ
jgi:peptidoglycan hydrolase-like protein with peptidoglycan-binding domain